MIKSQALPRIFDQLADAEQARAALLAAGFERDAVQVSARHDEAGPVEGNFVSGNAKKDTIRKTEFSKSAGGVGDNAYQHNFKQVVDRGVYMVTVDIADSDQLALACEIMARHGAIDVEDLLQGGRPTF
ncbi:MAG: hypothetical protein EOP38_08060 [Rubrivivax sp.]|nr:MAG: hypothetical protein EOP38_08060 [Rubrivivax sp.]